MTDIVCFVLVLFRQEIPQKVRQVRDKNDDPLSSYFTKNAVFHFVDGYMSTCKLLSMVGLLHSTQFLEYLY